MEEQEPKPFYKWISKPLLVGICFSLCFHFVTLNFIEKLYLGLSKDKSSFSGENTFLVSFSQNPEEKIVENQSTMPSNTPDQQALDDADHHAGDHPEVITQDEQITQEREVDIKQGDQLDEQHTQTNLSPDVAQEPVAQPPKAGPSEDLAPIEPPNDDENQQDNAHSQIKNVQFVQNVAYLLKTLPHYPRISKRLREQGTVFLKVYIDTEGLPVDVSVHVSSGHERLDDSATKAVYDWKFVPHKVGKKVLPVWVIIPVEFTL